MIWQAIQFDWPSAGLLLMIVIAIAWLLFFLYNYRKKKLQTFANQAVLEAILEKREPIFYWIKVFLYCLAWICGVFALMQPKGNERYISTAFNGQVSMEKPTLQNAHLRKNAHEVIFLVDASASMKIADVQGKTRLDVAKEIVDDVIRHLKGETISLVAFTSATMQIVPSTLDYLFTRLMLKQISINEGETEGTSIKQALEFVRQQFFAANSLKTKTLIVLSDGGDTDLVGLSPDKRKQEMMDIVSPIHDAEKKNLRVFAVGLGSLKGQEIPGVSFEGHPVISALEEPLLRRISATGRGELFVVNEMTPFQISQKLSQNIARDESFVDSSVELPFSDAGENTHVYDLYYQIPLAVAILALMGCLLIPDTRKKIEGRNVA